MDARFKLQNEFFLFLKSFGPHYNQVHVDTLPRAHDARSNNMWSHDQMLVDTNECDFNLILMLILKWF